MVPPCLMANAIRLVRYIGRSRLGLLCFSLEAHGRVQPCGISQNTYRIFTNSSGSLGNGLLLPLIALYQVVSGPRGS